MNTNHHAPHISPTNSTDRKPTEKPFSHPIAANGKADRKKQTVELCRRLAWARERAFGIRGKSAMARALGMSPSTYGYYERNRMPPPELLARAAELTGVHLDWLVSGQEPRDRTAAEIAAREELAGHGAQGDVRAALSRAAGDLGQSAAGGAVAQALSEILRMMRQNFPVEYRNESMTCNLDDPDRMVPVVGRTAAGLVADYKSLLGEQPAVTVAGIAAMSRGEGGVGFPAIAIEADDPQWSVEAPLLEEVALVQLDEPQKSGVSEFLDLPDFRRRWQGAFAMRVDGDSMKPRFRHGDLVVAVPGLEVGPGQAALVQIKGRLGVTLKLVRREGDQVHLVPINESYETTSVAASEIEWMAMVMFGVRIMK